MGECRISPGNSEGSVTFSEMNMWEKKCDWAVQPQKGQGKRHSSTMLGSGLGRPIQLGTLARKVGLGVVFVTFLCCQGSRADETG